MTGNQLLILSLTQVAQRVHLFSIALGRNHLCAAVQNRAQSFIRCTRFSFMVPRR